MCNEFDYIRFADIPQRKNVVNVSFPNQWLYDAFAKNFCLYVGHKDICESNDHLVPIAVP